MKPTQIGRLALRVDGDFWNAYFVPKQNGMDGALLLGSIRMSAATRSADVKWAFMELMKAAYSEAVLELTGELPTWSEPTAAPENERSGTA